MTYQVYYTIDADEEKVLRQIRVMSLRDLFESVKEPYSIVMIKDEWGQRVHMKDFPIE